MKTALIRERFLSFFESKGHTCVDSSPLVPGTDPSLLFTNAGMVQFKHCFLGDETRSYQRAVSSQCCLRAGGKHNDLENVGYTARHHTFFEMLGNFSFGDYFKKEAIAWAWAFLTEVLKLPEEKLWVTAHHTDEETAAIWQNEIGVPKERFAFCGDEDNFWQMGDTGPCGPCTEIFYDHGPDVPGGPPGSPDAEGDRFVEIWNLVFMQFERKASGDLVPLKKPSVDTGMGLERIAAVMQGVTNNYDIDLFQSMIQDIAALHPQSVALDEKGLRVIADHARSAAFLIAEGVYPGKEGRAYVLRRIIRRAIRHGVQLGFQTPFFAKTVAPLAKVMGDAYPILIQNQALIERVLTEEEAQFTKTLAHGLQVFEEALTDLDGQSLKGEWIFKLYDTYGFPLDLTADLAREKGLALDEAGFDRCMAEQVSRSRDNQQFESVKASQFENVPASTFMGYGTLSSEGQVLALYHEEKSVSALEAGQTGWVVLNETPFYPEGGGQVSDEGQLTHADVCLTLNTVQKQGESILHHVNVSSGTLLVGMTVHADVCSETREAVKRHHSATHLLHAALKVILGEHVQQRGSWVHHSGLRFDFSHPNAVSWDELKCIERLVNAVVCDNLPVLIEHLTLEEAKQSGAEALFGEKYGETVRVLSMGDFSKELCGGTHVQATGELGLFKITQESSVASGIRRIEACAGAQALEYILEQEAMLQKASRVLKTSSQELVDVLQQRMDAMKTLQKQVTQAKSAGLSEEVTRLWQEAYTEGGVACVAGCVSLSPKAMKECVDRLKEKIGSGVVVLASDEGEKLTLVTGVTADLTKRIKAGDWVKRLIEPLGGKGGGRPDLAQAGAALPENWPAAWDSVSKQVRSFLGELA